MVVKESLEHGVVLRGLAMSIGFMGSMVGAGLEQKKQTSHRSSGLLNLDLGLALKSFVYHSYKDQSIRKMLENPTVEDHPSSLHA